MESTNGAVRRASGFSAVIGVVSTLVMSTVVFVAFLIVPLIVLGLAFVIYFAWPSSRSRKKRPENATVDGATDAQSSAELPAYRFGTGG